MTDLDQRPATASAPRRRPDLRVSARGVRTVARLELRQRLRATRWLVVLLVWVGVLVGVSALVHAAAVSSGAEDEVGSLLFSAVAFLVLGVVHALRRVHFPPAQPDAVQRARRRAQARASQPAPRLRRAADPAAVAAWPGIHLPAAAAADAHDQGRAGPAHHLHPR